MEYFQQEINIHKNNLKCFINELVITQSINNEIIIINEMKKEIESLISLLNAKQNALMNQIKINNNIKLNQLNLHPNPMNAPSINMNQMQLQFMSNNFQNKNMVNTQIINVKFEKDSNITVLICNPDEKISEVIKKYKEKANDYDENWFRFNNRELDPFKTLSEFKIGNNSQITVIKKGILKGAKHFLKTSFKISNK